MQLLVEYLAYARWDITRAVLSVRRVSQSFTVSFLSEAWSWWYVEEITELVVYGGVGFFG